eukprot:711256-Amphidinium_carterae.1
MSHELCVASHRCYIEPVPAGDRFLRHLLASLQREAALVSLLYHRSTTSSYVHFAKFSNDETCQPEELWKAGSRLRWHITVTAKTIRHRLKFQQTSYRHTCLGD